MNILLIGAGQFGSRHLQGLSSIKEVAKVYVVDLNIEALKTAEHLLNEISSRNTKIEFYFLENLDTITKDIDLAIIATNSDVRKIVLYDLLKNKIVSNIILEKFLFQKEEDFFNADTLINEKKVNVWVNCARRMYPEYIKLKELFSNKNILEISVTGSNWAMGSNSIHFIDIFAFLTNCDEYSINNSLLLEYVFESKRAGFVEFNGKLNGKFVNGTEFCIECFPNSKVVIEIKIVLKDEVYIINQLEQTICKQRVYNGKWIIEKEDFKVHYQSDLTNLAASQILKENRCELTTFSSSMKLHLPLIRAFILHLKKLNKAFENEKCPIT